MATEVQNLQKINHIVVVMLENRSFDHMLGFLYKDSNNISPLGHPFEGLTGEETNPDSEGNPVRVFPIPADQHPYFWPGTDPGEGYNNTNSQLFGNYQTPAPGTRATNKGFIKNFEYTLAWQKKTNEQKPGSWPTVQGTKGSRIMGMYTPELLPVLSSLAKGYAVCDHWYCSVPTETLPNRAFVHMATSQGRLSDDDKEYSATTIFNRFEDGKYTWAIYGYTTPHLTRQSLQALPPHPANGQFGNFKNFQKAVTNGTLANYVFLAPEFGPDGNSQHPNDDVAKGEQFLHDIYTTLFGSRVWKKTLLVITYDEHGGCYDHVAPPDNATQPADCPDRDGFNFQRFGVRVPTVLVSPWIKAGTVYRVPDSPSRKKGKAKIPTPFDHTSILSTLEKRFRLRSLTVRDAAAPHLGGVLTLKTPRKDDPLAHVRPPQSEGPPPTERNGEYRGKPSHLQKVDTELASRLPIKDKDHDRHGYYYSKPEFESSDEAARYVSRRYNAYYHDEDRNYHERD